jgi:hypothetical protein
MQEGPLNPQLRCEIMVSIVLLMISEKFSKISNETFKSGKKKRCFLVTVCTVHYLHVQLESFSALHGQKTKIDNLVEER